MTKIDKDMEFLQGMIERYRILRREAYSKISPELPEDITELWSALCDYLDEDIQVIRELRNDLEEIALLLKEVNQ